LRPGQLRDDVARDAPPGEVAAQREGGLAKAPASNPAADLFLPLESPTRVTGSVSKNTPDLGQVFTFGAELA